MAYAGLDAPFNGRFQAGSLKHGLFLFERNDGRSFVVRCRGRQLAGHERALKHRCLVRELGDRYGVRSAPFWIAHGLDARQVHVTYYICAKVEGVDLLTSLSSIQPSEILPKAEAHYLSLFAYLHDKMVEGGWYLSDINNGQFMYGSIDSESPSIYLVDHDPAHHELPATRRARRQYPHKNARFHFQVAEVVNAMLEAERIVGRMEEPRRELSLLLDEMAQEPAGTERAEQIAQSLVTGQARLPSDWLL